MEDAERKLSLQYECEKLVHTGKCTRIKWPEAKTARILVTGKCTRIKGPEAKTARINSRHCWPKHLSIIRALAIEHWNDSMQHL